MERLASQSANSGFPEAGGSEDSAMPTHLRQQLNGSRAMMTFNLAETNDDRDSLTAAWAATIKQDVTVGTPQNVSSNEERGTI
jgi:hypothetical protein